MAKVLCIGDSCADIIIPYGQALNGEDVSAYFNCGGACANTAAALAKLGVSTAFIGRVGKDLYGLKMKEELDNCGVDTKHMIVDENSVSTQILVVLDKNGERTPFLMPKEKPSYLEIYPEDLHLDSDTQYIVTNGMMLFDEPAASAITDFLVKAKDNGIKIILDLNYRIETKNKDRKHLDKVVSITNILLGSVEDDFLTYTETNNLEDAFNKLLRPNLIMVAREAKGSTVKSECCSFYSETYEVDVVDTLGAGDAANAGFIYGLVNNVPLSCCNYYGCLLGAYCVTGKGARYTPDIIELMQFKTKDEQHIKN